MTPVDRLIDDLKSGCLISILILPIMYVCLTFGGYPPADECANAVKDSLSPYKTKQLINKSDTSYNSVREWCSINLTDWERKLESAQDYRESDYQID